MTPTLWTKIRGAAALLLALVAWLQASPVFAQASAEPPPAKSYGVSYMLTGLFLFLGVLIVCRPLFARADEMEKGRHADDDAPKKKKKKKPEGE